MWRWIGSTTAHFLGDGHEQVVEDFEPHRNRPRVTGGALAFERDGAGEDKAAFVASCACQPGFRPAVVEAGVDESAPGRGALSLSRIALPGDGAQSPKASPGTACGSAVAVPRPARERRSPRTLSARR